METFLFLCNKFDQKVSINTITLANSIDAEPTEVNFMYDKQSRKQWINFIKLVNV